MSLLAAVCCFGDSLAWLTWVTSEPRTHNSPHKIWVNTKIQKKKRNKITKTIIIINGTLGHALRSNPNPNSRRRRRRRCRLRPALSTSFWFFGLCHFYGLLTWLSYQHRHRVCMCKKSKKAKQGQTDFVKQNNNPNRKRNLSLSTRERRMETRKRKQFENNQTKRNTHNYFRLTKCTSRSKRSQFLILISNCSGFCF